MNRHLRFTLAALAFVTALAVASPARSQVLLVGEVDANRVDTFVNSGGSYILVGTHNNIPFPFGLAFNPSLNGGTLYVAGLGGQIFKSDINGLTPFASIGNFANGMVLDPAGNLYVSHYSATGTGSVLEFNSAGTLINTIGNGGGPTILDGPTGLAYANGTLYISSSLNGSVLQYTGGSLTNLGLPNSVSQPAGLAVDPTNGDVYVTNYDTGKITTINPSSPNTPTSFSTGAGTLPGDVVIGPGGDLLVSEYGTGKIAEYKPDGTLVSGNVLPFTLHGPVYMDFFGPGSAVASAAANELGFFAVVPEPASLVLLGLGGALGLGYRRRLQRRRPAA